MSSPSIPQSVGAENLQAPSTTVGLIPQGVYRAAPAALTDGDASPIPLDSTGAVRVTTGGSSAPVVANPTGISPSAARTTSGQLLAALANQRLTGFTYRETAGAVARFTLHHGTANTDPVIAFVGVSANTTGPGLGAGGDFGGEEVLAPNGVYLQVNSGAVEVIAFSKVVS